MATLLALLQELQLKLERFRKDGLKETPTRVLFVDPILEALGWSVKDPDEVQLEYPTIDGKSVDYACKIEKKTVLLVEAKSLNDPLSDVKDVTQTTGYAANDGIVWCILTNGVRWRVYRSVEKCPAPEKLMFEVSYDPLDLNGMSLEQAAEKFLRFSRGQVGKGALDELGEKTFTDGKIRKALTTLFSDPPKPLLKLVRNVAGDRNLRPQAIKESLERVLVPFLGDSHLRQSRTEQKRTTRATAPSKAAREGRARAQYTENHHTEGKPREVVDLFQKLDSYCLSLRPNSIRKKHQAKYISYSDGKRIFCSVHLQRGGLRVWLKLSFSEQNNPPPFARDVTHVGHWGTGDFELDISNSQQLVEAEPWIRKSFEKDH